MATVEVPVEQLQQAMRGPVFGPEHPAYELARSIFNGMIDRHPSLIARCANAEDVSAAVAFAERHELPVSIRGGGHSIAGHAVCDGGLMIDLRLLRQVQIDPERRRLRVGGGATWRDVDVVCDPHRLAMPGGTFDTTGVAGLTLNGGIGHLMGVQGLSLDNLVSARVVLADGTQTIASTEGDADLLWCLQGGGGNFGVVSEFEFALHPLPHAYGGLLIYGPQHMAEAVRLVRDVMAEAPDELTLMLFLNPEVPGGCVVVTACYAGPAADAEEAMRPLRDELPVLVDGLGLTSYLQIQVMVGDEPFGRRQYWKGHFLRGLADELIDEVLDAYQAHPTTGLDVVLIEFLHGAARRVPADATAFSRRDAPINLSPMSIWDDAGDDDAHMTWVRKMCDTVAGESITGGGYLNYGSTDESDQRVRAFYGEQTYDRLSRFKARYDPSNRFRFNHNIRPA